MATDSSQGSAPQGSGDPLHAVLDQEALRRSQLHARIDRDFIYHAPRPGQRPIYVEIRKRARDLGHYLVDALPNCRELHRALSDLEDVTFHANAGVARHPDHYAGRAPDEYDEEQDGEEEAEEPAED